MAKKEGAAKTTKKVRSTDKEKLSPVYHDTLRLLKNYRNARWNLKLSQEQHKADFEAEYGMDIEEYLESVYQAGVEFTGTKLEHHANSMMRTAKMLELIDATANMIRENHRDGETYYWVLYYTYFTPQELSGWAEIIERVQYHVRFRLSKEIYYVRRKEAINVFSSVLWGFVSNENKCILEEFFQEVKNAEV